jgi:hypothetical protein
LVNSVEALSSFGWAAACYLAVARHGLWAAAAVTVGLAGPVTAWLVARMRKGD